MPPRRGLAQRFYLHAYQYASQANLIAVHLPEVWYLDHSDVYQQIYRFDSPRLDSIIRSALGRAVVEEVLDRHVQVGRTNSLVSAPTSTAQGFHRLLDPGFDINFRASLPHTAGATVRYNTGDFSLSSTYSTQIHGFDAVNLSYPFAEHGYRGEIGVTSTGGVWVDFVGRW